MKKARIIIIVCVCIFSVIVGVLFPCSKLFWKKHIVQVFPMNDSHTKQSVYMFVPYSYEKDEKVKKVADQLISVADKFYNEYGYINRVDERPECAIVSTGYKNVVYNIIDLQGTAKWQVTVYYENQEYKFDVEEISDNAYKAKDLSFLNDTSLEDVSVTYEINPSMQELQPQWQETMTFTDVHILRRVLSSIDCAKSVKTDELPASEEKKIDLVIKTATNSCKITVWLDKIQIEGNMYSVPKTCFYGIVSAIGSSQP